MDAPVLKKYSYNFAYTAIYNSEEKNIFVLTRNEMNLFRLVLTLIILKMLISIQLFGISSFFIFVFSFISLFISRK